MKEYTIFLGGEERTLEYRLRDRLEIQAKFPKPDGKPGSLLEMIREINPQGSLEVFSYMLWVGLRRGDKKLTYEKTLDLLEERYNELEESTTWDELAKEIYHPVFNAIGTSRVLGLDVHMKIQGDEGEERGKGPRAIKASGF